MNYKCLQLKMVHGHCSLINNMFHTCMSGCELTSESKACVHVQYVFWMREHVRIQGVYALHIRPDLCAYFQYAPAVQQQHC